MHLRGYTMEATSDNRKTVNVEPNDWTALAREARELGMSRSELLRRIVREWLENRHGAQPRGNHRGSPKAPKAL